MVIHHSLLQYNFVHVGYFLESRYYDILILLIEKNLVWKAILSHCKLSSSIMVMVYLSVHNEVYLCSVSFLQSSMRRWRHKVEHEYILYIGIKDPEYIQEKYIDDDIG